jgi:Protein of unknown function (DUF4242)
MPKFIIERNIPGAGKLDHQQLAAITQASYSVIKSIGPQIQWIESYFTDDKLYCVYIAPDEATIREHARLGHPADSAQVVRSVIDPAFAGSGNGEIGWGAERGPLLPPHKCGGSHGRPDGAIIIGLILNPSGVWFPHEGRVPHVSLVFR